MRGSLRIICFILFLFPVLSAEGQRKREVPRHWEAPKYKWAAGARIGNPLGASLKRYTWNNKAIELIAGRPLFWFYNNDELFRYRFRDKDYRYLRHRIPFSVQARMLQHQHFSEDRDRLSFYYGGGVQMRRVEFQYQNKKQDKSERTAYWGIGPEIVLGIEYHPENTPINVFADANLYIEVFDKPFTLEPQFAAGVRYIWGYWFERNSNARR